MFYKDKFTTNVYKIASSSGPLVGLNSCGFELWWVVEFGMHLILGLDVINGIRALPNEVCRGEALYCPCFVILFGGSTRMSTL